MAALEIMRGAQVLFAERSTSSELGMRLGLHTGPVIGGVVGSSRTAWDVWGDAVNIAARMEQSGERGRIHISEAFAQALRGTELVVSERGTVSIKGKGEMRTYWLG
jgi:class 3 adenylate cyclase